MDLETIQGKLPRWARWLAPALFVVVTVALGWLLLFRPRREELTPVTELGGIGPEEYLEFEAAEIHVLEEQLEEADQELRDVLDSPDLDTRSKELADLLNRRR